MSNTFTDLNTEIYTDSFLEAFVADLLPISRFSRNFSPDVTEKGKTVKVPFVPAQEAAATFGTAGYVTQAAEASGKDIVLSEHIYVSFSHSDIEQAEKRQVNAEMFFRQKAHKLALAVVQNVLGVVTLANFGSAVFTGAASTFDGDSVVEIKDAVDLLDMPKDMRSLVLDSEYYNALLNDSAGIRDAYAYGSAEAIRDGRFPRLLGFDMIESTIIPENSQNLKGFVAYPDAIGVGMRYLDPVSGHDLIEARPVTDPQGSGITLGYRQWYDPKLGRMEYVMECLFGKLTMNDASLKRVISAV